MQSAATVFRNANMPPIFLIKSLLASAAVSFAACNGRVKTGLDVLIESDYAQLAGKKVIALSNPTGVTPQLDLGIDVMVQSGKVDIVGIMGPEHGFRGTAQAGDAEGTFVDEKTGITVYDAYLANTTTLISFIEDSGADTVLFDIQDVGARFYTCKKFPTCSSVSDGLQMSGPCMTR